MSAMKNDLKMLFIFAIAVAVLSAFLAKS